jgi:hypothetical protein
MIGGRCMGLVRSLEGESRGPLLRLRADKASLNASTGENTAGPDLRR